MYPQSNERIQASAWAAARGALKGLPQRPGLCLALARVIVEAALGMDSHELYARYLVAGTSRRKGDERARLAAAKLDPWAADLEASAKRLGWAVPAAERLSGDLVFDHAAAQPYGHVGVLLDHSTVLENIDPAYRPGSIILPNHLALTPFRARPWTLVARVGGREGVVGG